MFRGVLRLGRRMFGSRMGRMDKLMQQLSEQVARQGITGHKQQQQAMRNYLELTEESYTQHVIEQLKNKEGHMQVIDPRLILMVLPTLEQQESIKEHLSLLYPYLSFLNSQELTLFYEYLLAHKPQVLPKLPAPKSLNNNQSLLVILGEIYQKHQLIQWLKQVPLYQGDNVYMLAMGAFSIIADIDRSQHHSTVSRCMDRIRELFAGADNEARSGVILLALESELPIAQELILAPYSLDLEELDGLKLSLLLIELDRYTKKHYADFRAENPNARDATEVEMDEVQVEGVEKLQKTHKHKKPYIYDPDKPTQVKFKLEQRMSIIIKHLKKQEWRLVIKQHIMVRLFGVLRGRALEKAWYGFSQKLFNFAALKDQLVLLAGLNSEELVGMLEVLEMHKIDKPSIVKQILVGLSQRLQTAQAEILIRLSKCLVTYVRLCEDYLLHFRVILEKRKFIFSMEQLRQLDQNFRRVQSLFPRLLSK